MAKFHIIGEGTGFSDSWGLNSTGTCAVRINGNCIERLGRDNKWITGYNAGKPIKKLLWDQNGTIHAVMEDGSVKSSTVHLSCNPKNRPQTYVYETEEEEESSSREDKKKGGIFSNGWWWKWPFKLIAWLFAASFLDFLNKQKN